MASIKTNCSTACIFDLINERKFCPLYYNYRQVIAMSHKIKGLVSLVFCNFRNIKRVILILNFIRPHTTTYYVINQFFNAYC